MDTLDGILEKHCGTRNPCPVSPRNLSPRHNAKVVPKGRLERHGHKLLRRGGKKSEVVSVVNQLIATNQPEKLTLAHDILKVLLPKDDLLNITLLNGWGLYHRGKGRLRESCRVLKMALDRFRRRLNAFHDFAHHKLFVDVLLNLCGVKLSLGEHQSAHTYCTMAIHSIHERPGYFADAPRQQQLESAIQLAMAQYNLGAILEHLKRPEFALQAYTFAMKTAKHAGCRQIANIAKKAKQSLQNNNDDNE